MLKRLVEEGNSPWTTAQGNDADIVLCSRIRLARNFEQYPFPLKQSEESGHQVLDLMKNFCTDHPQLEYYNLEEVDAMEKQVLVEKHYISPEHCKDDHHCRGLAIDEAGKISIMINEEDHLRIQCFAPGLDLQGLWQKADELDDQIEHKFDYRSEERRVGKEC